MKKQNVLIVDFKHGKKKKAQEKSNSGKCCPSLEKCAGHSLNS